jgi:hypothetical protein
MNIKAQYGYWQQKADYLMDIDFDVKKHQFEGKQTITYTNNSSDTLYNLYYYLFFNAFQPNSMMDIRSRSISDPDRRVGARISRLSEDEMGYQKIKYVKVDGQKQNFHIEGTILEISLKDPILPNQTSRLELEFNAQVPIQIRRSGRDNKEGIDYSMAQWFPKLCEFDKLGWHAYPYVGREFHGIWGNYDVTIEIDSDYVLAATGELQNAADIGYGYAEEPKKRPKKLEWHFVAENVIDFMWAADRDYTHTAYTAHDGTILRFFYQPGKKTTENWKQLPQIMDEALKFINENFGKYPYPVYNFIQGGDGGMEYPMGTLITGERTLTSLVGVSVHEWMHSWYQMMLATNEAKYPWMDEGFTSYASTEVMDHLKRAKLIPGEAFDNPHLGSVKGYANFTQSGLEEPLSTPADHFNTNAAYGAGSYSKGSLTLVQLGYIMGEKSMRSGLLRYFNEWKFKHPTPDDFFRVMEKTSQMELDWFQDYWVNTTKTMDYAIDTLIGNNLHLTNMGSFPMPLDILVTTKEGKQHMYYIPLTMMRQDKPQESEFNLYTIAQDWPWTNRSYILELQTSEEDIQSIEIDPSGRMLDVDRSNNIRTIKQ